MNVRDRPIADVLDERHVLSEVLLVTLVAIEKELEQAAGRAGLGRRRCGRRHLSENGQWQRQSANQRTDQQKASERSAGHFGCRGDRPVRRFGGATAAAFLQTRGHESFVLFVVKAFCFQTLLVDQHGRRADPGQALVVVDAHHPSAAHAAEREHGAIPVAVADHHHADLDLRRAVRRVDDRREVHALLQDEMPAIRRRNRRDLLIGRREDDAAAGKREQRLQQPLVAVLRHHRDVVEIVRARHPRDGAATGIENLLIRKNQSGPPTHSTSRASPASEWPREPLPLELVGNHAVVDALDLRRLAVTGQVEHAPRRSISRRSTGRTPQSCSVTAKSGQRLLMVRIDLHQHDFGRVVIADDRALDEREVLARASGRPRTASTP